MKRLLTFLLLFLSVSMPAVCQKSGSPDTRKLGKALDYFTGGKYHEALLLFKELDTKYKLNPRFKAYIGICYYSEWEYAAAFKYLDSALPSLEVYSPAERNVYYNAAAESHFLLEEYSKAVPLYEKQLLVCRDDEKGDVFYRLGFCHLFQNNFQDAADYFRSAVTFYERHDRTAHSSRAIQAKKMIKGCEEKIKKSIDETPKDAE